LVALLKIKMFKVCIDSNVYISALAFGGKPTKVIELALARKFILLTSLAIINEVKRNLIEKLELKERDVQVFLADLTQKMQTSKVAVNRVLNPDKPFHYA
jgi:putative PIN family toxin of toxin-antitoxin system